jgi:hypothetical protein
MPLRTEPNFPINVVGNCACQGVRLVVYRQRQSHDRSTRCNDYDDKIESLAAAVLAALELMIDLACVLPVPNWQDLSTLLMDFSSEPWLISSRSCFEKEQSSRN